MDMDVSIGNLEIAVMTDEHGFGSMARFYDYCGQRSTIVVAKDTRRGLLAWLWRNRRLWRPLKQSCPKFSHRTGESCFDGKLAEFLPRT